MHKEKRDLNNAPIQLSDSVEGIRSINGPSQNLWSSGSDKQVLSEVLIEKNEYNQEEHLGSMKETRF